MKKDNKKQFREAKRQVKKDGNRERRRDLKRQLIEDPENAHLVDDEYDYGFNSSTHYNNIDRDSTRIRKKQQEYEEYMHQQDYQEEDERR